jgi:hypothetical protein
MTPKGNPDPELAQSAGRFIEVFRHVFHYDWEHTRLALKAFRFYSDGIGTFITPGLENDEESYNWQARGLLLDAFRELSELLRERGLHPDQRPEEPIPDDPA